MDVKPGQKIRLTHEFVVKHVKGSFILSDDDRSFWVGEDAEIELLEPYPEYGVVAELAEAGRLDKVLDLRILSEDHFLRIYARRAMELGAHV